MTLFLHVRISNDVLTNKKVKETSFLPWRSQKGLETVFWPMIAWFLIFWPRLYFFSIVITYIYYFFPRYFTHGNNIPSLSLSYFHGLWRVVKITHQVCEPVIFTMVMLQMVAKITRTLNSTSGLQLFWVTSSPILLVVKDHVICWNSFGNM